MTGSNWFKEMVRSLAWAPLLHSFVSPVFLHFFPAWAPLVGLLAASASCVPRLCIPARVSLLSSSLRFICPLCLFSFVSQLGCLWSNLLLPLLHLSPVFFWHLFPKQFTGSTAFVGFWSGLRLPPFHLSPSLGASGRLWLPPFLLSSRSPFIFFQLGRLWSGLWPPLLRLSPSLGASGWVSGCLPVLFLGCLPSFVPGSPFICFHGRQGDRRQDEGRQPHRRQDEGR